MISDALYSIQLETQSLKGFLAHQESIIELENIFSEQVYFHKVHGMLFSVLKNLVLSGKKVDKVLLSQKTKELGFTTFEGIDIFIYVDDLGYSPPNKEGLVNIVKELVGLKISRDLSSMGKEIDNYVVKNRTLPPDKLIAGVDNIYNKPINTYIKTNEPIDMYAGMEEYIKELALNKDSRKGFITPFEQYNKFFGELQRGDSSYLYAGRMQEGKSVWLFNLARGISILNNAKILYLDSEMSVALNRQRAFAAESGLNPFHLRHGTWTKNDELAKKVLNSFKEIKKYNGLYFHEYVPNKDIKEIQSIAKRWFHKYVGRGNKAMIVMDYLKITTDADKNRNEFQQFGDKMSYLNELGSELDVVMAVGAQQNRNARQGNGERLDDDTTIGGSDRINQFARFAAIFRMKSAEEIAECPNYGTHILKPIKWSRDEGIEDFKKHSWVKIKDRKKNKFLPNYLNYEINYYDIKERGTLKDVIAQKQLSAPLQNDHTNNDNTTI